MVWRVGLLEHALLWHFAHLVEGSLVVIVWLWL